MQLLACLQFLTHCGNFNRHTHRTRMVTTLTDRLTDRPCLAGKCPGAPLRVRCTATAYQDAEAAAGGPAGTSAQPARQPQRQRTPHNSSRIHVHRSVRFCLVLPVLDFLIPRPAAQCVRQKSTNNKSPCCCWTAQAATLPSTDVAKTRNTCHFSALHNTAQHQDSTAQYCSAPG
jgi:hypothetical protein